MPAPKHPASEVAVHKEMSPLQQNPDRALITHPLIRRAAEKALADGGEAAKYIVRDGDRIYFAFNRIKDPVQRENAVELIRNAQESGQVSITELIRFVRRVLNK